MSAIDVERLSEPERLLWRYGVTKPEHINLDAIAEDQGAPVRYAPLCGCEARLVAIGKKAAITVNSGSRPERQRFSVGHELAHWRDRHTGGFQCAQEDISPQNVKAKSAEADANAYASQLLLPSYLVDPWILGRKTSLDTAKQLGQDFRASLTASAIKLVKRSAVAACVLCHKQRGLSWFAKNDAMPEDTYIPSELSHETAAFGMVFEDGERMSRPSVEPASRWVSSQALRTAEVESQSVRLSEGVVLTVIAVKTSAAAKRRSAPRR
jgi:hypothetical protein